MNPAGDRLPLAQQTKRGQCKFKHDKCFMGNKEQWQEKEKQMEKKKEKETELLNANMKTIKHKSQTQFEF